jgi:hypothetical protein
MHQIGGAGITLKCVVPGCPWASAPRIFACLGHWSKIPGELQNGVWSAYKSRSSGAPKKAELLNDMVYVCAAVKALDFIGVIEQKQISSIFHSAVQKLASRHEVELEVIASGFELQVDELSVQ